VRLDRAEGLNQSELAEMLDLQPITLTRLLDKLADSGLIERRPDPDDRRAKRLFLTPAARPVLEHLSTVGEDIMAAVLEGLEPRAVERMISQLTVTRENLRRLMQQRHARAAAEDRRYG
jgi:MarR family transcriptional regulator for hemolysin